MKARIWLLALLMVSIGAVVSAEVPRIMSYQGVLKNADGTLVPDGNYTLTFRLYTTPSGGTALWTEAQTTQVSGGIFNVNLGSQTPLSLAFDTWYWLGVTVGSEAEMTPRVVLASAPYGFRAAMADSAMHAPGLTLPYHATTASSSTQFWITNNGTGTAGYFENTGNSSNPALYARSGPNGEGLIASHTSGNNAHLGTSSSGVVGNAGTGEGVKGWASGSALGVFGTNVTAGNYGQLGTPSYGVYGYSSTGYAGYFDGNVSMTGFKLPTGASAGKVLTSDASGAGTWQTPAAAPDADWTINGSDMYAGVSGNVGIGLTNPNRKLYVAQGVAGLSYPLKLDNTDIAIGTAATGILFSVGGSGVERGKGALVYRCEDTWNRGSFHFLQSSGVNTNNPTMSDAVLTITNSGRVGVKTTAPTVALEVSGGVKATDTGGEGVRGEGSTQGVVGSCLSRTTLGQLATQMDGVFAHTDEYQGSGVWAEGVGVEGTGVTATGTWYGVCAYSEAGTGTGVYGHGFRALVGETLGGVYDRAGLFFGDVKIFGNLEFGLARSTTDHPSDPDNRTLRNAAVEAPEQLLLYRGIATLDGDGEARVVLPSYFKDLVREDAASVNLTPVGRSRTSQRYEFSYDWEPSLDRFVVYGEPGRRVAWLVLAERDDATARAHPLQVEQEKGTDGLSAKGELIDPVAYGRPWKVHGPSARQRALPGD